MNPIQEKDLQRHIDAWLEVEVIKPSTSPWASALIPVKKKGSEKLRWAVDYCRLNEVTIKDTYPLANIECNLRKLATEEMFSKLDSARVFHTMPIREEDRDLTAFVIPFGHYHFSKLPFSIANAPAAYSKLVQIALDRLPRGFSIGFIDDIVIYSSTIQEHVDHIRQVVQLHAAVGMKLNLNKCHIMRREVEYLGHLVSQKRYTDDTQLCGQDPGLAAPRNWQRSCLLSGLYWILQSIYKGIFSLDSGDEWNEER